MLGVLQTALVLSGLAVSELDALRVMVQPVAVAPQAETRLKVSTAHVSTLLSQAIHSETGWEAVTHDDIRSVLDKTAEASLLGCDGVGCAVDFAELVRAQLLLRTEIGIAGEKLLVSSSLIDVNEARVIAIASQQISPDSIAQSGLNELVLRLLNEHRDRAKTDVEKIDYQTSSSAFAVSSAGKSKPLFDLGKTMVADTSVEDRSLPPNAGTAFSQRLAATLSSLPGVEVTSEQEIRKLIDQEASRQLLGSTSGDVLLQIAEKADAEHLVTSRVVRFGTRYEAAIELIRQSDATTLQRLALPVATVEQLPASATVLARRMLGLPAQLPTPPAPASRFDDAMNKIALRISDSFAPLRSDKTKIAVLPFVEVDAFARRQKAGKAAARVLGTRLKQAWDLPVVSLANESESENPSLLATEKAAERAIEAGARAVVVGKVSRIGTDMLVETKLIDVLGGKTLSVPYAFIPLGDLKSLIPAEAVVLRTRADALFRSVVPGWGQFYNGPKHYWKGGIVLGGVTLSLAFAAGLFGAAQWAATEKSQYDIVQPKWLAAGCTRDAENFCQNKRDELDAQSRQLSLFSAGPLMAAALFYVYGFVDAGLSAADYGDLVE